MPSNRWQLCRNDNTGKSCRFRQKSPQPVTGMPLATPSSRLARPVPVHSAVKVNRPVANTSPGKGLSDETSHLHQRCCFGIVTCQHQQFGSRGHSPFVRGSTTRLPWRTRSGRRLRVPRPLSAPPLPACLSGLSHLPTVARHQPLRLASRRLATAWQPLRLRPGTLGFPPHRPLAPLRRSMPLTRVPHAVSGGRAAGAYATSHFGGTVKIFKRRAAPPC